MRLFFLLVLTLIGRLAFAQISIWPESLNDSTQNYLYIGVENTIRIDGLSSGHIVSVSGGGATLTKKDSHHFLVLVTSVTDECRVSVSNTKDGKILSTKPFRVRNTPEPTFMLDSQIIRLNDTTIIKKDIIESEPLLSIVLPNCYLKRVYNILYFRIIIEQSRDSATSYEVKGNKLNSMVIAAIGRINKKDLWMFDQIKIIGPDDGFRNQQRFWIRIE